MKRLDIGILGGGLLVLLGILFMLQNLGIVSSGFALLWVILFGLGGLAFLYVFVTNVEHWWALIPGCTLLGIAALIGLDQLLPQFAAVVGGALFLGAISLSFWLIYFVKRENWWAVIPGGTLATLALVAGLSEALGGVDLGGLFFLGLGATFALVAVLPTPEGQMKWAFIPAGVLLAMGTLISLAAESLLAYVGPLALIVGGGYLVVRAIGSR